MSLPDDRLGRPRTRTVWLWTATGTSVAVLLLWGGTQLAKANGQNVDWYTGFGQWLGALGSLIAAVVALWIATTDRQHTERARQAERDEVAADRAREAGLVFVVAKKLMTDDSVTPVTLEAGVYVKNWRNSRIFDLEISRFVQDGVVVDDLKFKRRIILYPNPGGVAEKLELLPVLSLQTDQTLSLFPKDLPDVPAEYVALRYTDETGRRWEVDTNGGPARKIS
ncbi:hypothetical protein [Nocardia mikamii]|uniref:hypothetical protein n=1 Tax=Nocardia mikamii TaxID=508464 RepID=UPI0007A54112|nr:hypothetical protein [Nocardia mikamii]